MDDRTFRTALLGLLASTAMATPAFAADTAAQPAAPAPTTAPTLESDQDSIIITATKREENMQNVPISVQALGTKRLDQLNISNFEQYTKQLPSVSFQNFGSPGRGPEMKPGLVIAVEPMVMLGSHETRVLADGWTVVTADGSLAAHFEHTIAVTEDGHEVLTARIS